MTKPRHPSPPAWTVTVSNRAWQQIREAPPETRVKALHWILEKLPKNPLPETRGRTHAHGVVDPLRSAQRKKRKGMHVRIGGAWRLMHVVMPDSREVFVYDCVPHIDDRLYTPKYMRAMLEAARKNPAWFA